jgi:hypothetical protein
MVEEGLGNGLVNVHVVVPQLSLLLRLLKLYLLARANFAQIWALHWEFAGKPRIILGKGVKYSQAGGVRWFQPNISQFNEGHRPGSVAKFLTERGVDTELAAYAASSTN